MTELAIKYVANPFANMGRRILGIFESIGQARAAAELARMGYHEEAKRLMLQRAKVKK